MRKVCPQSFPCVSRRNSLQFEGQTKGKLGTSEARSAADAVISENLAYFLEENRDTATLLVKKRLKQARPVKRPVKREAAKAQKIRSDAERKTHTGRFQKSGEE
ncbi:hypothetical protein QNN00_17045 [Bacillus velezensis]|nr:hypothetical protein [Bacillus velezensis]